MLSTCKYCRHTKGENFMTIVHCTDCVTGVIILVDMIKLYKYNNYNEQLLASPNCVYIYIIIIFIPSPTLKVM